MNVRMIVHCAVIGAFLWTAPSLMPAWAGPDTARTYGSAKIFVWGIKMSADGKSFVIDPIRDQSIKRGTADAVFYRW